MCPEAPDKFYTFPSHVISWITWLLLGAKEEALSYPPLNWKKKVRRSENNSYRHW